jgi:hypothetical protein
MSPCPLTGHRKNSTGRDDDGIKKIVSANYPKMPILRAKFLSNG